MDVEFDAELWLWTGDAGWHFVSLPEDVADDIRDCVGGATRGFGSVKVHVQVGETRWDTSLFPDSKNGTYVLPIKKQVRQREDIVVGDVVHVRLELVDH
ncbi:MAG: DUF1905 domain-containing protein [Actinomycetota bacterium]|nr:DUF1905 domain-containing protein [Actinomycetota bacterium]